MIARLGGFPVAAARALGGAAVYEKRRLRYTLAILGDRELAEVFVTSADGLLVDLPSPEGLRKRLKRLIERFT